MNFSSLLTYILLQVGGSGSIVFQHHQILRICPFCVDLYGRMFYNNGIPDAVATAKVTQLIQESFEYSFIPTGIFIATWDNVLQYFAYRYGYGILVSFVLILVAKLNSH